MGLKVVRVAAPALLALLLAAVQVDAFSGGAVLPLSPPRALGGGASARALPPGQAGATVRMARALEGGADPIGRRRVLAGLAVLPLVPSGLAVVAEEGAAAVDPEEVVVEGEMRFEVGTDTKFAKLGGKGTALVTLRVVGKGIIAEKKISVEAGDFPPAGKPAKGKEVGGGVPFVIKAKELREKTEKGRTVTKEGLWGDDDIFVRVDLLQGDSTKKIASGLGKAKYVFDTQKHQTSFVLLE